MDNRKREPSIQKILFGTINKKLLFWFLIIAILPLIILGFVALDSLVNNTYSDTLYENNVNLLVESRSVEALLSGIEGDVLFLSQTPELSTLINTEETNTYNESKIKLRETFISFAKSKPIYYQVKYIDETGMEIISTENNKKEIILKPQNSLQNKKTSYYFTDAMNASKGVVYVSPLEPYFENGKIENRGTEIDPIYVPVIRYATPLFSENGEKKGIILLTLYADTLLDTLKKPYLEGQKTMLVNNEGYYLYNPDNSKEWGFIFDEKDNVRSEFLEQGNEIIYDSKTQGISENEEYFFFYKRIYPSENIEKSIESGQYSSFLSNPQGKDYYWVLIIQLSKLSITSTINRSIENSYSTAVFILLIIALFSFFISKRISDPIKKLGEVAAQMEKGNFNVNAQVNSNDELEELAIAMNRTIQALKKTDVIRKQLDSAKTEFLSITSHELRSPMTPMRAQLQMILKGYMGKLNPKQKHSLEIVLRNTERLDEIIKDFLEVSRIEAARLKFEFEKTDLTKYIRQSVKEMDNYMPEKNIKIETHIEKLPIIEADPNRVMQVLRNLITNAKKFSPPNTKIIVGAALDGDFIKFHVKDQGIGVSLENKLRIFEPFFQAEQTIYREHGGTGLGLTICKGIVESQNGVIWVESKKGKGTTIYFTIPLKPVRAAQSIKLLFSEKENINRRIKKTFGMMLGPLGIDEFNKLQKGRNLSHDKINKYINSIIRKGVLNKKEGKYFIELINKIYEDETGRTNE